jgi:hypothetical protein
MEEARATIAELLKSNPSYTLKYEATWPAGKMPQLVEPLQQAFLDDVRKAGMPE